MTTAVKCQRWSLLALAVLLAGGCGSGRQQEEDPAAKLEALYQEHTDDFNAPELSVEGILAIPTNQLLMVDVRSKSEQAVSKIPGALTRQEFEPLIPACTNRMIVTYCTIGARSGIYAERLRKKGLEAFNFKGSILAWAQAGLPLVDSTGITKRVHVYGERWNVLPDDYEATW